ncbi:MAG: glycosyltransferase family 4 protein [Deltaproteobacteria bacterium]|nr:glycosyltransferase family 4 protein [Deltaproteobacteria bacterium]MBW1913962.1 glycosyltransferase family 4 protein [Deltaproteobacteria bacterium]
MSKKFLAISNHGTMIGGGEHSFLDLVSNMPDSWEVVAVVPEKGELEHRLCEKGVHTEIAPLPIIRPWKIAEIINGIKAYRDLIRKFSPSIIYANGSRAAFYSGIAGRSLKVSVVWHCRIAEPDRKLDFILARLSSIIVANSHATAKRFVPCFQSRIRVVHNGIDTKYMSAPDVHVPDLIHKGWKVMLAAARISKWKRHELIIDAFERVALSDSDVHLVCIGAPDDLDSDWWDLVQEMSRNSRFSSRIHWLGQVSDVRPWFRSASVLVLASDNEPFGRVLVEGMACGVPVVAARGGGVVEIVRDRIDGFLVTLGSAREMAEAINIILQDSSLARQMGESGRSRAEAFSLVNHVKKMCEIFNEIDT